MLPVRPRESFLRIQDWCVGAQPQDSTTTVPCESEFPRYPLKVYKESRDSGVRRNDVAGAGWRRAVAQVEEIATVT